ncbi:MAG: ferrous iron transport protein B [Nitrospirae bacterium]|nr:ferrous iron transport protein B [Nitrospirota bacterium]MBF0541125.1 ferrous iron transport protein B [Nitrospirota bacterium]
MKKDKNSDIKSSKFPKIALLGLPNTGKTSVFNNLTGKYNIVANYPLTTIENKTIITTIKDIQYKIIDTPGLYCLYIHSEDELVVRDMIFEERPDIIVQCIDSAKLKQSLMLTLDLLELEIPLIISLNAMDEIARRGIWIDSKELSRFLGVEVIESITTYGKGTNKLKIAISKAARSRVSFKYAHDVEGQIESVINTLHDESFYRRKIAILLLMDDPFILKYLKKSYSQDEINGIAQEIKNVKLRFTGNLGRAMIGHQSRLVDDITEKIIHKQDVSPREYSQYFATLSRHPIYGIPIALFFIAVLFFMVVNVATFIANTFERIIWLPIYEYLKGALPSGFIYNFLIGDYGILSLGLANALVTILPILSVFFLMFNTLEDIGYIPNLSVLSKRVFDKIGLSGAAICPLVLALGCKTMATLTTKTLHSPKERFIAITLITFGIPCGAQLGVSLNVLGRQGISALLIVAGIMFILDLIVGLLLNKMIIEDEKSIYLQMLPPIRMPDPLAVLKKTYYRLYWFLLEAVPIFMFVAVILFVLDNIGVLAGLRKLLSPLIVGYLGLPEQMLDVIIVCLGRKEVAASMLIKLVEQNLLNYVQVIVSVLFIMFIPCIANVGAVFKELELKKALSMTAAVYIFAFVLTGALNHLLIFLKL